MKHLFIKKGNYIIKEGNYSNKFYCIISGKVSIRKLTNDNTIQHKQQMNTSVSPFVLQDDNEKELFIKGEGYCFGDVELIYNIPHTKSLLCLEDTHLFMINEETFTKHFAKCIHKAISNRREFIINNLFPFNNVSYSIINDTVKTIIPIETTSNITIYQQGEYASKIYIIYIDQCTLFKKSGGRVHKLLTVGKGSVLGLETIYEEDKKYKYTLKTDIKNGIGMILCLNVEYVVPLLIKRMRRCFRKYYEMFETSVNEIFVKKIQYEQKRIEVLMSSSNNNSNNNNVINDYTVKEEMKNYFNCNKKYQCKKEIVKHKHFICKPFMLTKNVSFKHKSECYHHDSNNINTINVCKNEGRKYKKNLSLLLLDCSNKHHQCNYSSSINLLSTKSAVNNNNKSITTSLSPLPVINSNNESLSNCKKESCVINYNTKTINVHMQRNGSCEDYLSFIAKRLNNGISKMYNDQVKLYTKNKRKKVYNYNSGSFDIPLAFSFS